MSPVSERQNIPKSGLSGINEESYTLVNQKSQDDDQIAATRPVGVRL